MIKKMHTVTEFTLHSSTLSSDMLCICAVQYSKPPATEGQGVLEMWLVKLRNYIFYFIKFSLNLSSHLWLHMDSKAPEA